VVAVVAESLADVVGVPSSRVRVTLTVARRLEAASRRRLAGRVSAEYTIEVPVGSSQSSSEPTPTSIAAALGGMPAEAMTAKVSSRVEQAVGAGVYSVVVAVMSEPVVISSGDLPAPDALAEDQDSDTSTASAIGIVFGALAASLCCVALACVVLRRRSPKARGNRNDSEVMPMRDAGLAGALPRTDAELEIDSGYDGTVRRAGEPGEDGLGNAYVATTV